VRSSLVLSMLEVFVGNSLVILVLVVARIFLVKLEVLVLVLLVALVAVLFVEELLVLVFLVELLFVALVPGAIQRFLFWPAEVLR